LHQSKSFIAATSFFLLYSFVNVRTRRGIYHDFLNEKENILYKTVLFAVPPDI